MIEPAINGPLLFFIVVLASFALGGLILMVMGICGAGERGDLVFLGGMTVAFALVLLAIICFMAGQA